MAAPILTTSSPRWNTSAVQFYQDSWRNETRTLRYVGKCWACHRRTYQFDDGENDPRGILGDHAGAPLVASDYGAHGERLPLCFACANEEASYKAALAYARSHLWHGGTP